VPRDVFAKSTCKYLLVAYHLQFPRPGPCARATLSYPVRPEGHSSSPRIFLHLSSSVIRADTAPRTVLGAIVSHNPYCNSHCGYVPCHTIPVGLSPLSPLHPVSPRLVALFCFHAPCFALGASTWHRMLKLSLLSYSRHKTQALHLTRCTPPTARVESSTRDRIVQQDFG
jgi:hypothetical protein